MEHLLNVYASRVARGHCADFLGYCEVDDSEANPRLTAGLWLVGRDRSAKDGNVADTNVFYRRVAASGRFMGHFREQPAPYGRAVARGRNWPCG